jgi:hypothetical protein
MTVTVWSNAGKFEWILWDGENVVERSGLIFSSYAKAVLAASNYVAKF